MLDPQLNHLLESAIDTSCKLAIVTTFAEQRNLSATPSEMAARVCRDIWSVESSLTELAQDGILTLRDNRYTLGTSPDLSRKLALLRETYAHPLLRNELQRMLREIEQFAPYRRELRLQRAKQLAA